MIIEQGAAPSGSVARTICSDSVEQADAPRVIRRDCHFLATNASFASMRLSPFRLQILALGLVLVFCTSGAEEASARSRKHHFDSLTVPSIPVDATGTPVIMQGLERPTRAVEDRHHGRKEAKRPVYIPRGSASLVFQ